jgi:hypothetical protein
MKTRKLLARLVVQLAPPARPTRFAPTRLRLIAALALLLAVGGPASAHHSTIGQMREDLTEIHGTVKEFQFKNPHSWIQVLVTDANGNTTEWSVEWLIPNILMRQGYNPSTFKPGDEVTIRLNQHVSGAPMGEFAGALKADGRMIGAWSE